MTSTIPKSAGWRDHPRYPDPAIETLDERFDKYRIFSAAVERLYTGCRWSEGPVWFGDGRYLLWSDIPNNRILKWEEETGKVTDYRRPSDYANGNTRDRQGRLVTCEHGGRRVTRTEHDGAITVLMDAWRGARLNSPNDVVVKSDGSIWFTDPQFGILSDYEGHKAEAEVAQTVYRIDGESGEATALADDILGPTGCASRPTNACSMSSNPAACRTARSSPSTSPTMAARSPTAASISTPAPAARPMACAATSTATCGAAGAWATRPSTASSSSRPDGAKIGRIALPERCANVCFGGRKRNRLFMAASQSLYALYVNIQGVKGG